jgi:hypothetical protein
MLSGMLHELIRKLASNPRAGWFQRCPELVGISVGTDAPRLVFEVEKAPARPLPSSISFSGIDIPTDVVPVGKTQPSLFVANPANPLDGNGVDPLSPKPIARWQSDIVGTLGVRVFRGEGEGRQHFVLGCFHVLCAPELRRGKLSAQPQSRTAPLDSPGFIANAAQNPVGWVTEGELDGAKGMDAALAEIDHEHPIVQSLPRHKGFRRLRQEHLDGTHRVRSWGRQSWHKTSVIRAFPVVQRISYPHGNLLMRGLIEVDRLADEGDSGAVAVNLDNELIGVIVATNTRFSYLMPIGRVLTELEVELWLPEETHV